MKSVGILWAQYGPYHLARAAAVKRLLGADRVHALELAGKTRDYAWDRSTAGVDLITLFPEGTAETVGFSEVFRRSRETFRRLQLDVCMLPSYAPKQSLAALMAAKSLGIRTVMMNESHAGTARARGPARAVKRALVALFDTALVGGQPHKRYFTSLGMPESRIFTGYDAVDNDYFSARAREARSREPELRASYALPENYFLSLGRFVSKKNLPVLIQAYRKLLDVCPGSQSHLVMVGSGPEEPALRSLCRALQLPVHDKPSGTIPAGGGSSADPRRTRQCPVGVHFYGFRQVEENPIFYALARAFVLPSVHEEWGLVVNEAMACGLPVVVSEVAGCAEDLLPPGFPSLPGELSADVHRRLSQVSARIRQNGFIFDPSSPESLCSALRLLDASPELGRSMGDVSRRIVGRFSCEGFARSAAMAAQQTFPGGHMERAAGELGAG